MKMKKGLLIIIDGMADRPVKALGGKTPLEHGVFPSFNEVARRGINGLMDPVGPGIAIGSDTSHISILGYDAFKVYKGRGYLEALGEGLPIKEGDIGFRVNFATVRDGAVIDRRAGRIQEGQAALAQAINEGIKLPVQVIFKESTGHRGALILRGSGLSEKVTDSDPHAVNERVREVKPLAKEAEFTAQVLNEFIKQSAEILSKHEVNIERIKKGLLPANYLLIRGAGVKPEVETFKQKFKLNGACIAATALVRGVAAALGLELLKVEGMTGEYNTNELAKARETIKALEKYDFVFTHFKPTDAASHDANVKLKLEMLEKADRMVGYILANINLEEIVLCLTADHTTPLEVGEHTGDPVPIAIAGEAVRVDDVNKFNERSCAKGGLGRIKGNELLNILLNYMNRMEKFGA
jgi:2,3-bisphosphoglycerate-independent phosphoglycerate mutase